MGRENFEKKKKKKNGDWDRTCVDLLVGGMDLRREIKLERENFLFLCITRPTEMCFRSNFLYWILDSNDGTGVPGRKCRRWVIDEGLNFF